MRKSGLSHYKQARLIEHLLPELRREIIAYELETESEAMFGGEFDEGYFGGKGKGQARTGCRRQNPRFRLIKEGWKGLYQDYSRRVRGTLIPIIKRKVVPDSIVYSDCWRGNNVLELSDFHHLRINQGKRHRRKFNAVPKEHFELFLQAM